MECRFCNTELTIPFLDFGFAPPSNAYLTAEDLLMPETYFPLKVMVCSSCWLVQTLDYCQPEELFTRDYAYLSSTSKSWIDHCARFSDEVVSKLDLNENSFVVEVASNDGYLLENFNRKSIRCLGIEPTRAAAEIAQSKGIETVIEFLDIDLAKRVSSKHGKADLVVGNNVLAHVPDISGFVGSVETLLSDEGQFVFEFPHLLNLINFKQFDTVYHEHFSYLSLSIVSKVAQANGLKVIDVDEISTHGGSLRVWGAKQGSKHVETGRVQKILKIERNFGLETEELYLSLQQQLVNQKNDFVRYLFEKKAEGKRIIGLGAAAKGNTLLNFCGIKTDLVEAIFDGAVLKQGKFMPGSHIQILNPERMTEIQADIAVIFPWNIANEMMSLYAATYPINNLEFVVAVPEIKVMTL